MYRVMIVDDSELCRRYMKLLNIWDESSGFVIAEEAVDGLDALKKLEVNPVDLVITDIRMPGMDGIELLRVVTEKKLCSCVVLLSDYTEYTYARLGIIYGAFDYVAKPIQTKELTQVLERIRNYLQEKQQEEQKLAKLQGMVEETFVNKTDIHHIIYLIGKGDKKACILAEELLDMLEEYNRQDKNQALLFLKNTIHEVAEELTRQHTWLPLYYDICLHHRIKYTNTEDWRSVKSQVLLAMENLLVVMKRFIPCHNNDIVLDACRYILMNLNEKLSVSQIADELYISKAYLSEIFKQKTGGTLLEYITIVKMERTKKLLQEDNYKNYEIAQQLGFQDNEYFNRLFKKYTGVSLSEYRQIYKLEKELLHIS